MEIGSAELAMEPKSTVEVEAGEAKRLLSLVEDLDELDDDEAVRANIDIPDEMLEEAAA